MPTVRAIWALLLGVVAHPVAGEIRFVDVTDETGISYRQTRGGVGGVSAADYDGDGWIDLCFGGSTVDGTCLYRNNGDGTFTDVTAAVLPVDVVDAYIAVFADLNDDGWVDLLLGERTPDDWSGLVVLRNEGGVFTEQEPYASTLHPSRIGGIAAADLDGDRDLDVVLTHKTGPGRCLLNENGVLTDATAWFGAGIADVRRHMATLLCDLNEDRRPDLFAAVDYSGNHYAASLPTGGWMDATSAAGVGGGGSDMGVALGDIDNDADFDLFITNIAYQVLYVNDGTGHFANEAGPRGVRFNGNFGVGWGTALADFDLDRDLDLVYVTSGAPMGAVFENDGTGYFTNVTADSGFYAQGRGLVAFDFDRDGDLDLAVGDERDDARIYRNVSEHPGRHWLMVELAGSTSNAFGIGARITAESLGTPLVRQVVTSESFLTGVPPQAHLGLGAADVVDRLVVEWPSGTVQTLYNVRADRYLRIAERPCQADVDADGRVGLSDLAVVLRRFGLCNGDFGDTHAGDLDGDGCIRIEDLLVLLERFGDVCN